MSEKKPPAKIGRPARISGEKHTKEKIFDAAIDLFSRTGYDRTTVRQIAQAVGLTESAVYRHYPSKEAILDAILAYEDSRIFSPLPVELSQGEVDGDSIFRGLLRPLPAIIMTDPYLVKIARILFAEMLHNRDIRNYVRKEFGEKAKDYTEALFARQMERGSIRACDPRALARVFNAFRTEWVFETFIADFGERRLDVGALEKSLEAPIRFFEELFLPGGPSK